MRLAGQMSRASGETDTRTSGQRSRQDTDPSPISFSLKPALRQHQAVTLASPCYSHLCVGAQLAREPDGYWPAHSIGNTELVQSTKSVTGRDLSQMECHRVSLMLLSGDLRISQPHLHWKELGLKLGETGFTSAAVNSRIQHL